jgi:hypothetical protein
MGSAARSNEVMAAIEAAALGDSYALVRDSATRALVAIDAGAAKSVLERIERADPEAEVRATAHELLEHAP